MNIQLPDEPKYPHVVGRRNVCLTGQEFYERLENELKKLISRGDGETWMGWGCGEVREAARRAAGLVPDDATESPRKDQGADNE